MTTLDQIARHAAAVLPEVRTHVRYAVPGFPDTTITRDGVAVGTPERTSEVATPV